LDKLGTNSATRKGGVVAFPALKTMCLPITLHHVQLPLVPALAEATLMSSSMRAGHSKDGKVLMNGLLLTVTE
jgi:hypothetical protein